MPSTYPDAETELRAADAGPAELTSTSPVFWSPQHFLVMFFLLIVGCGFIIQTAVELQRGQKIRALEVFRRKPTATNLRAYEHNLEDASVVAKAMRPLFQFAQFSWLRDGGEKVLVGREGWLFYKPGYADMVARHQSAPAGGAAAENPATANDPVGAIVAWRDALAERGIRLVIMPAPNKESIYADRLTSRVPAGSSVMSPVTRDLLQRLAAAEVECVNLFELLGEARKERGSADAPPLYLQQDSHWSPRGVELAASAVAKRLLEKGWVTPGDSKYREKPSPVNRIGDVLRMLQSPEFERRTKPEAVPCVQVVDSATSQPYRDDPSSEILVIGDSFLRIYEQDEPGSAGFVAHLAKELQRPLSSVINDGGASTLVRQEIHRRPALLKNTRVIVWEFVERDIRLGTEGWQHVPLQ